MYASGDLSREFEVNSDDGGDFDGVPINEKRAITPGADRVGRCASKQAVAFDDTHVFDRSLL